MFVRWAQTQGFPLLCLNHPTITSYLRIYLGYSQNLYLFIYLTGKLEPNCASQVAIWSICSTDPILSMFHFSENYQKLVFFRFLGKNMEVGARIWKDKLNIYHLELTPFIILLDHVTLLILSSIIIFSLKINGFSFKEPWTFLSGILFNWMMNIYPSHMLDNRIILTIWSKYQFDLPKESIHFKISSIKYR